MKFIILTASTGEGHNQAAKNLKLEIEKNSEDTCIIYNILAKNKMPIIEMAYEFLATTTPDLYGLLYKISDNKYSNKIFLKNFLMYSVYNVNKLLKEEKPDVIISTHPFSVPIIARVKKYFKVRIPFIQIVTDFKAHYTYVDKWVDAYITASEFTKNSLIERKIDEKKIFAFGIPIKSEFRTKLDNNSKKFNILVMGGSMGLKSMQKSLEVLMDAKLDITVDVVCGKNERLRKKLLKKFAKEIEDNKMRVFSYTDKISEMMDNSKLLITKPGGLTSSEAISKNLPMIIPFSIPGQEKENTAFLVESNMALEINKISLLPKYIEELLNDESKYNKMVENMKKLSSGYSVSKIIELAKKIK